MEIVEKCGRAYTVDKNGDKIHLAEIDGIHFMGTEGRGFHGDPDHEECVFGYILGNERQILRPFMIFMPIGDAFDLAFFEEACADIAEPYVEAA